MISPKTFYTVIGLCVLVYILAMFCVPLMDVDASQYASISREMLQRKSFLQIYDQGADYLDKPPLLFWLSALSMYVFGVHDWAYRLPSVIMLCVAVYSLYRFAAIHYVKSIARTSAMILASSQAVFLMAHDVRTDTMLMGWVMLSIWQLSKWYSSDEWKHFLLGFAAIGAGMATKGPVALMVPVFGFAVHFAVRREWKQFFRWEYLLGIVVIGVVLFPMCVGLYRQYDLHPGKLINGIPIHSGLKFYFWTQSFGRYTGENFYHEMSYFTFLLENMLWSFLPWIIFFLVGLAISFYYLFLQIRGRIPAFENVSIGGFVLTYCVLAKSQAQLPHYIFVVFPLASIVTAVFIENILREGAWPKLKRALTYFHILLFSLLWIAVVVLLYIPFSNIPLVIPALAAFGLPVLYILFFSKTTRLPSLLKAAFFTVIGVNIFLVTAFYPNLLKYQMGNDAAKVIRQKQLPKDKIKLYNIHNSNALHFYAQHIFPVENNIANYSKGDILLTVKDSATNMLQRFPGSTILHEGPNYAVSVLSAEFLNPATREAHLPKYVMLQLGSE